MRSSVSAVYLAAAVALISAFAGKRTTSKLQPESLARTEAITTYCEKVDPNALALYSSKLGGVMRGHSEAEIQNNRNSARYQQAMARAGQALANASYDTGIRACGEFLAER